MFDDGLTDAIQEVEFIPTAKSWNGKVYGCVKKGFYIIQKDKRIALEAGQAKYVKNHARELYAAIHGEDMARLILG